MMKTVMTILLVLAACSKQSDDKPRHEPEKHEPGSGTARPAPPKPTPLPIKAFVELATGQLAFKPQNVLGKTPVDVAKALPQYLRKDETSAQVKAMTDEMMKELQKEVEKFGVDTKATDIAFRLPPTPASTEKSTHVIVHLDDTTIREYGVWFRTTPDEVQQILKGFDDVWGGHKMVDETLGVRTTWFDAKAGIRASTRLEKDKPDRLDINYVRYLPLASFFGEPGALWGFEKKEQPLLGATVEQLQAAYGKEAIKLDAPAGTATLTLPPTDYDGNSATTTILLFIERGKVRQWNVSLPYKDYEPARAEYQAALDAKFGKPKPARHEHFLYGKKPTVDVQYSKYTNELDIEVR